MGPLGQHLVGYLSIFLQLGVLLTLTLLAGLVRLSLGRRAIDAWTVGLGAYALALAVLATSAVGRDAGVLPPLPLAAIAYAALEDVWALCFIAALRRARGASALSAPLVGFAAATLAAVAVVTARGSGFFDSYSIHAAGVALLLSFAVIEAMRARRSGAALPLIAFSLAALAADYMHVPLLRALGVALPASYLGLESYVTAVLDVILGVAIVVHASDGVRTQLESRNEKLARVQAELEAAAFTDPLCGVPNRAAFLERLADPPSSGVVAMIDLDGLKVINDRFGHAAGDIALATTARCLEESCGRNGHIYRIGGDEFVGIWTMVGPDIVRESLAGVERTLAVVGDEIAAPPRISWGMVAFDGATSFAEALAAADAQLYDRRSVRRV